MQRLVVALLSHREKSPAMRATSLALPLLLAAACSGDGGGPRPITQSREVDVTPGRDKVGATSAERFGSMSGGGHAGATAKATPELVWDNPPGWTELPPNSMRTANLKPAGHPDAECYLSLLPGGAGGMVDNVNRWRKQMSLPPIDAEAVKALPKQELLGLDAVRVDLTGAFAGMAEGPGKADFQLIGLLTTFGDQSIFVKMTGPAAVISAEAANFDRFVASLELLQPADAAARRATGATASGAPESSAPAGGAAAGAGTASAPVAGADGRVSATNQGIRFTGPIGWTADAPRATRVVTLRPPGTKQTECVVSVLGGDGGGVSGNVDRWRGQLGLGPLAAAEFAALPRVILAGRDGVQLDLLGALDDAMTARKLPQARLLGAIALLEGKALFVKLTGPEAEIDEAVKNGFLELCASLAE